MSVKSKFRATKSPVTLMNDRAGVSTALMRILTLASCMKFRLDHDYGLRFSSRKLINKLKTVVDAIPNVAADDENSIMFSTRSSSSDMHKVSYS